MIRHRKERRRQAYRFLNKMFGDPSGYTSKDRIAMLILLGGWVGQHRKGDTPEWGIRHMIQSNDRPSRGRDKLLNDTYRQRAAVLAERAFQKKARKHFGHWSVQANLEWSDYRRIEAPYRKQLNIAISPAYHISVAKHGLEHDGRKIVQKIWGYRQYTDMEVWECHFWDLNKLGRDDNSWNKCTHRQGYVAKTSFGDIAVDEDLQRAIRAATKRTADKSMQSILSDVEEEPGN